VRNRPPIFSSVPRASWVLFGLQAGALTWFGIEWAQGGAPGRAAFVTLFAARALQAVYFREWTRRRVPLNPFSGAYAPPHGNEGRAPGRAAKRST
jgi:hypothetical protein